MKQELAVTLSRRAALEAIMDLVWESDDFVVSTTGCGGTLVRY